MHAGGHGMKAQFRRADASGARHALVFGADEVARGEVGLKTLRDPSAAQRSLPLAAVEDWAADCCPAPNAPRRWPIIRRFAEAPAWPRISISKNRNSSTS